jgi:hypothetical protein
MRKLLEEAQVLTERKKPDGFVPTKAVAKAAERGLEARRDAKPSKKGGLTVSQASAQGIGSGVQRAVDLKNRDRISLDTIKRMKGFFSRHQKNIQKAYAKGLKPEDSKAIQADLLWGGRPGERWVKGILKKHMGEGSHDDLVRAIQVVLTPDLLKPSFRELAKGKHSTCGHCYAASEALYHLLGGKAKGFKPVRAKDEDGITHWWVESPTGEILDPTAEQYTSVGKVPPYAQGRPAGFLTRGPSKRAREIMRRLGGQHLVEHVFSIPTWNGTAWGTGTYSVNRPSIARSSRIGVHPTEPSVPFRYQSAKDIYALIKDLYIDLPMASPEDVVKQAISISPYSGEEISAEDYKLLVMSVDFLQNGFPPNVDKNHVQSLVRGGVADWHSR